MTTVLMAAAGILCAGLLWLCCKARRRNVLLWLPAYLKGDWPGRRERRSLEDSATVHVMLCVADHFEPGWGRPPDKVRQSRVEHWVRHYPRMAEGFRDADGRPPRHTFFFPAEEYRPGLLDRLAELVRAGYGEVEVHLHHDDDTSAGLRDSLLGFAERLRRHGLIGRDRETGRPRFAFVHGNWALDNSRRDGRWCGVNDELRVLRECGCFADFTLPSAPSDTQTRRINSIYYAVDDPARPRSHDDGVEVRRGGSEAGDLMIVQGPLSLRWPGGRFRLLPRLENGRIAGGAPPTPRRAASWVRTGVCIGGRPDLVFVKLYTHGCQEKNRDVLLGEPMRRLHAHLARAFNDGTHYRLHYVTARELYNVIKAAEEGVPGDPGRWRDYRVLPPACAGGRPSRKPEGMEAHVD